ncbi:hypothetical protein PGH12_15230 [Chryseobacterium wangxinyae]|uniref:hypothetical protein n=1 Tax=Chryseobacterium sp. CY350 TaxID=2997336 RepID=UPI002271E82B|nr:hypothetical protein [Chryseobacterium sp. CY350]MCY0977716.1 hypothetical protein [Chryseobacterium sp. CY350]WBZ94806.1 hypothetical protein PGH12_15230 [Chryseobacterium sp. CY350]
MKWTAKYDFIDLYKVKVNGGSFNPGSAIRLAKIEIPYENTIILGGSKDENSFDPKKTGDIAVLFASKDRGKNYQEIIIGEKDMEYMESKGDYTLIKAYTMDSVAVKHYKILLLNNKTFELQKVDEYIRPANLSDYYYSDFDGKYIVLENYGTFTIVNLLNRKEEYKIPTNKIGDYFFYTGNGRIVYKKDNEIREYNAITQEDKLLNKLKNKYDYFFYIDNQLTLQNKIFDDGDKFQYDIYDINENPLYTKTPENKYFYRYKNFVCDYRKLGAKPEIRYSYDYGKTWKSHHVQGFTILSSLVGFYKDQFLVTEGIFWHFDSPKSGGRVMVGEFVK